MARRYRQYLSIILADKSIKRNCTVCPDIIDGNASFESDDEEIFEAVMREINEKDICVECAMANALMNQTTVSDRRFLGDDYCDVCGEVWCECYD